MTDFNALAFYIVFNAVSCGLLRYTRYIISRWLFVRHACEDVIFMSRVPFPRVLINRYYTRVTVILHCSCGPFSCGSARRVSFICTGFDHTIMFIRAWRNYLLRNGTVRLVDMGVVSTQAWGWGTVWGTRFGNRRYVPYARILTIWIVDTNAVDFFGDSLINSFEWGRFWGIATFIRIFFSHFDLAM